MNFIPIKILSNLPINRDIQQTQKIVFSTLILALIFIASGCSSSHKFDARELQKMGKVAVISHSEYQIVYIPSPYKKLTGEDEKIVVELEAFLKEFPLSKTVRQKFTKALIDSHLQLDLVPETVLEKIEDSSLQNCLIWAKTNKVDTVIHLESIIEVSHAYRTHDVPLRYYPKVWTEARIIRLRDNKLLWSKKVWTHAMDGTAAGLPSYSAYDTVFDRNCLETLIDKKLDFIVKNLIKNLS
jgi:hypothetical protein